MPNVFIPRFHNFRRTNQRDGLMFIVKKHGRGVSAALVAAMLACSSTGMAASLLVYSPTPEMGAVQGSPTSSRLSIRLKNRGVDSTAMAVWSVVLTVVPEPGASGSVKLSAPIVPSDYIGEDYTPMGMIMGPDPAPVTTGVYTDFVWAPTGILLPAGLDGGLFDVDLVISPDALGKFSVLMLPYHENTLLGSAWSEISEMGTPIPLGNVGPEEHLMTVVNVTPMPEPATGLLALGAITALLCVARRPTIC